MLGTFRLAAWQEGPPGGGQGGLAAYRFCETAGRDLSVRLHAPVPLATDLAVHEQDDGRFVAIDPAGGTVILSGVPAEFVGSDPAPVTVEEAGAARRRTEVHAGIHGAPNCFSCGLHAESMGVHPGPLDDGRFATDLHPPPWAVTDDGFVEPFVVWAALDCTAGVYVGSVPDDRIVVTANYQVKVYRQRIEPGPLAVVAFPIDPDWDGRKRWAGSAAFDADGAIVAEARSLWVSLGSP